MSDYASAPPRKSLDTAGIVVSALCILHCMSVPIAAVMLPALAGMLADLEWVHVALVIIAAPVALVSLSRGCMWHHTRTPLILAVPALGCLCFSLFIHEPEWAEAVLTTIGAAILVFCHGWNVSLLRRRAVI